MPCVGIALLPPSYCFIIGKLDFSVALVTVVCFACEASMSLHVCLHQTLKLLRRKHQRHIIYNIVELSLRNLFLSQTNLPKDNSPKEAAFIFCAEKPA